MEFVSLFTILFVSAVIVFAGWVAQQDGAPGATVSGWELSFPLCLVAEDVEQATTSQSALRRGE